MREPALSNPRFQQKARPSQVDSGKKRGRARFS